MRNTIAVMNTKGGVGKSTLVLSVAETLSAVFRKNVLIIDSDSQASVSAMLLSATNLHRLQSDGLTIVDLLVAICGGRRLRRGRGAHRLFDPERHAAHAV